MRILLLMPSLSLARNALDYEQLFHEKAKQVRSKRAKQNTISRDKLCDSPHCIRNISLGVAPASSDTAKAREAASSPTRMENAASTNSAGTSATGGSKGPPVDSEDQNRRWTCKSHKCQGQKSFHQHCLIPLVSSTPRYASSPAVIAAGHANGARMNVMDDDDDDEVQVIQPPGTGARSNVPSSSSSGGGTVGTSTSGTQLALPRSASVTSASSVSDSETESDNDESDEPWEPESESDRKSVAPARGSPGMEIDLTSDTDDAGTGATTRLNTSRLPPVSALTIPHNQRPWEGNGKGSRLAGQGSNLTTSRSPQDRGRGAFSSVETPTGRERSAHAGRAGRVSVNTEDPASSTLTGDVAHGRFACPLCKNVVATAAQIAEAALE